MTTQPKDGALGFVEVFSLSDKLIGAGGALGMFGLGRLFKNADSLKERVRKLEKDVAVIRVTQENQFVKLNEMDGYIHKTFHSVINKLNTKELKDQVVDDLFSSMERIEAKIDKYEK